MLGYYPTFSEEIRNMYILHVDYVQTTILYIKTQTWYIYNHKQVFDSAGWEEKNRHFELLYKNELVLGAADTKIIFYPNVSNKKKNAFHFLKRTSVSSHKQSFGIYIYNNIYIYIYIYIIASTCKSIVS